MEANTVQCRYNAVNFLRNIHKRHPIARPWGRGMGCRLWVNHLIDILPEFLQLYMQYLIISDRVIAALNCIVWVTITTKLPILVGLLKLYPPWSNFTAVLLLQNYIQQSTECLMSWKQIPPSRQMTQDTFITITMQGQAVRQQLHYPINIHVFVSGL